MRLRRNAWGGSNGSLRSSRGGEGYGHVPARVVCWCKERFPSLPQILPPRPSLAGDGSGRTPGLSHAGKTRCSQQKLVSKTWDFHLLARWLLLKVGVGMGGALPIVAMPVPLAPQLEIMRLWTQKMGMRMREGKDERFRLLLLLLLLLLCSCRVSLVWKA